MSINNFILKCLVLSGVIIHGEAHSALTCPPMPIAVTAINNDIKSDINLSAGSLGKIKAGEIGVKTETTATNLFIKYPSIDKLLISQSLASSYCSMLNSASLGDNERLDRWERFSDKLIKYTSPVPSNPDKKDTETKVKVTVTRTITTYTFVRRVETTITTRDHHCSHSCEGEPTRTGYSITLSIPDHPAGKTYELRNQKLECISGPCGGWNKITSDANITPDKLKATASFDVWSKPTTWRLSADYYQQQ